MANRNFFHYIMAGEWEAVISSCRENRGNIFIPPTKTEDNVIHLAVSRGKMDQLMELLNIASPEDLERKNKEGESPLHLAAMRGHRRMCEQLCWKRPEAVFVRNSNGEAPMYLASVMGEMGAFSILLDEFMQQFSEPEPQVSWDQMSGIQRDRLNAACIRDDKDTILHAAIRGEFIDLAYKIFEQFRLLAIIKNRAGEMPNHLSAKLPSLFKSGYRPGILKIFSCNFMEFFLPKSVLKEQRKHVLSYKMVGEIIKYLKQQQGENQSNPWMRSENTTTNPLEETVANRNTSEDASTGNLLAETYTDAPIVSAVKMGITEMVSMIVQSFPFTVEEVNRHGKNLIFLAAESRQPQVLLLLLKLNIRQTLITERLEDEKMCFMWLQNLIPGR